MYNLFNKFPSDISALLLRIHVCNSDNPINWLKQPKVFYSELLKFFRFPILNNRPVFHYKGLVGDIDR